MQSDRGTMILRTHTVSATAPRLTAAHEDLIARRWEHWSARCEHESARLASSMLPRETLLYIYQMTHRRAIIAAIARDIPASTIIYADLDDPLIEESARRTKLEQTAARKVRKQEVRDARRT